MSDERWWGSHDIPSGGRLELTLGPLTLWVSRFEREWRVGAVRDDDTLRSGAAVTLFDGREPVERPDDTAWDRFAQRETAGSVTLTPGLMDRAFVVRPYAKLHLLPTQEVVVYVTTPLVVRITDEQAAAPMVDVPVTRPSETWYGADTMNGSVCYAGRTHARLQPEQLERRASRATTAIRFVNRSEEPHWVEHLYVPVTRMALWEDPTTGALLTDAITVTHDRDHEETEVRRGPPCEGALRVSTPRESQQGVSVLHMLNQFWGAGG
ncbi:MAG: hypothetical protein KC593_25440 [Myxococcales bacterium]|nr:hypothetical protein [Myxococcales bacterium]